MSYQDKQLKKEFITLDNRTIPFGYPQFWGGDDWEVSGRDNPLPVANYTQNEQDLWVPVSNENPVPTQLTGSNVGDERIINNETIVDGSYISTSARNTKGASRIGFLVEFPSGFESYKIYYLDDVSSGVSRYEVEDIKGMTRFKRFYVNTVSNVYRLRIDNNGNDGVTVSAWAFYYY